MEKVTVIIPTFNRKNMLERCINSVLNSSYNNYEIILADDFSTDGTGKIVKKYLKNKKIKYIRNNKPMLLSYTINNAIRLSSGSFIFILDDDNVIAKDCISLLVNSLVKNLDLGAIGPLSLYYSKKNVIMHAGAERSGFMRRAIYPYQNEIWNNQINEEKTVHDLLNAFMFRKNLIKKIGMWDLLVPFMGEDGDFQARIRKFGYKIAINPNAITYHDIKYDPKSKYFMRLNKMRLYHAMHSKILYEYRYDNTVGKITFTLSIPIYLLYYLFKIGSYKENVTKSDLVKGLLLGTIIGLKDALMHKNNIERL